jgi:hypothetical protein
MQFFQHNGQWLNLEMMKKVKAKLDREKEIFCPFCVSKAIRHTKDCPTRVEGFDKETAHVLTEEEREKLIQEKELINK